jgi:hypothetical protein
MREDREPGSLADASRAIFNNKFVTNRHLDFIPRRINGPAEKEIRPDKVDEDLPEPRHDAIYISYKRNESID